MKRKNYIFWFSFIEDGCYEECFKAWTDRKKRFNADEFIEWLCDMMEFLDWIYDDVDTEFLKEEYK